MVPKLLILLLIIMTIYYHPIIMSAKIPRITISNYNSVTPPMVLYRTMKSPHTNMKLYQNCHQKWIDINTNLRIEWFFGQDMDKYMITQPSIVADCYNTLIPGVFKSDLWRLCILYENGGAYADSETIPYTSLKNMMRGVKTTFISVLDPPQSGGGIHNGFIICTPRHPFIKACIDRIVHNVQEREYTDHSLGITGPLCLARAINTVLDRPIHTPFREGLNEHGSLSFYLYKFEYGPFQYVWKQNTIILSKKHCTISYMISKLNGGYSSRWKKRAVYRT